MTIPASITDRGVIQRYKHLLSTKQIETHWMRLAEFISSTKSKEEFVHWGSSPTLSKHIGQGKAHTPQEYSFAVEDEKYRAQVEIPLDYVLEGEGQHVDRFLNGMTTRWFTHWGGLIASVIKAGESKICYDGLPFFSASHVYRNSDSPTQSNLLSFEVASADTAAPTVEEASEIINLMINQMTGFVDDQNEPRNEDAKMFMLMVPHSLRNVFTAATKAVTVADAAGIITNPIVASDQYNVEVIPSVRLGNAAEVNGGVAWTDQIVMARTDAEDGKALILHENTTRGNGIKLKGRDSEYAIDNDQIQATVDAKRSVGFGEWQSMVKLQMTT